MAYASYVDAEYSFGNFGNIQQTKEFKELLKKGIITKRTEVISGPHHPFSRSGTQGIVLDHYGKHTTIRVSIIAAEQKANLNINPSIIISQNRTKEVFILDFDKIFSNIHLDVMEVSGVMYSIFTGDAMGVIFTLYGLLKNVVKAGNTYISEDVAYMHVYFKLKLKNYRLVTKDYLEKAYLEFFKEIKIDNELIEILFTFVCK